MVGAQIARRGIKDEGVLRAMRKVPRHLFVDTEFRTKAYDDMALPTQHGQTISQPYMVAVMTELINAEGAKKVLEVGTGSGYQTAILSELSEEVYTVERFPELSEKSERTLSSLGYRNIRFSVGDGSLGLPEDAPFERIIVTAGAPEVPETLISQLSEGGIIVIPVGDLRSQQLLKCIKRGGRLIEEHHTPCVFVPLIGQYAWKKQGDSYRDS